MSIIKDGKMYSKLTSTPDKYSDKLKQQIERSGALCCKRAGASNSDMPILMVGNIQSGKTRAFIGLMALCFDNDFDVAIILTKCSRALVKQTVQRMNTEFKEMPVKVVAKDILEINSKIGDDKMLNSFITSYPGGKKIIVAKKQAGNLDRIENFVNCIVDRNKRLKLLLIDDEADVTGIGFESKNAKDDDEVSSDVSLRRISGKLNDIRSKLFSNGANADAVSYAFVQVTATPYSLLLQPKYYYNKDMTINEKIMPLKPSNAIVLPTGKGYIGGQYYFIAADDEKYSDYSKAHYLYSAVSQEEMDFLSGKEKNKSGNPKVADGRIVKTRPVKSSDWKKIIENYKSYLPSVVNWVTGILVGASVIQLNNPNNYVSAVMHISTEKRYHNIQEEKLQCIIEAFKHLNEDELQKEIDESYKDISLSVREYDVLALPSIEEVTEYIKNSLLEEQVVVYKVNSEGDITSLLNDDGELDCSHLLNIYVGGSVLDRGITIKNMIGFFYGRNPSVKQMDTVMQHCRMFGYRTPEILSVTRFYTTKELRESMKDITVSDNHLRELLKNNPDLSDEEFFVLIEKKTKLISCARSKILASEILNTSVSGRLLPIGFRPKEDHSDLDNDPVTKLLENNGINFRTDKTHCLSLKSAKTQAKENKQDVSEYVLDNPEKFCWITKRSIVLSLLKEVYNNIEVLEKVSDKAKLTSFEEMMKALTYVETIVGEQNDEEYSVAVIIRTGRKNELYSRNDKNGKEKPADNPDTTQDDAGLAKIICDRMPILILLQEIPREGDIIPYGYNENKGFWWPVYINSSKSTKAIYSANKSAVGVSEFTPKPNKKTDNDAENK